MDVRSRKTILIVDDDKEIVELLSFFLEDLDNNHFTFHIDNAFDGHEALKGMSEKKYDAVFLDLMMPNLNGDDVIKEIRQKPGPNQNVPFVIVSGFMSHVKLQQKIGNLDKVFFIDKPFSQAKIERIAMLCLIDQKP